MQIALREEREPHRYESRSNKHEATHPLVKVEWRISHAPPPMPRKFSALLGDCIHNLRAALDYCTWAAASPDARSSNATQVAFPLHDTAKGFNEWKRKRGSWYGAATLDVIERAQPFHANESERIHQLKLLQVLSNTDKHRLLNVADYVHMDLGPVVVEPEPEGLVSWVADDGPVSVGDVIARIEFRRPLGDGHEVLLKPLFGWYECVRYEPPGGEAQWLMVGEMMNAIAPFVVDVITDMSAARKLDAGTAVYVGSGPA
jgi:hypothetical protein